MEKGRNLAWDVTCANTFAASHLQGTNVGAGAAANVTERNKIAKYQHLVDTVEFVPVAVETMGSWGPRGYELISELEGAPRKSSANRDPQHSCSSDFP